MLLIEYIRGSGAPECTFHNEHKTLYYLFSPGSAVSCVADKQVSHHAMCTLRSISLHFIFESVISVYHGCIHLGHMDSISSIFVRLFSKIIWEAFYFTDHTLQMYMLIVHFTLMDKQWRQTQISVHIYVPFDQAGFIKWHFGTGSVISDQAAMYM